MLERETIKNSLSIAAISPDEFAYNLMKGPGYMAVRACIPSMAVRACNVQCIPVEVEIQHGEECFSQLQVTGNNETWFLTPKTNILLKRGTQIDCNSALPPYYRIDGTWYKILPRPVEAIAPTVINAVINATWTYQNPALLATSRIYTDADLEKLRDHINFPLEKPSLINYLARRLKKP